MKKLFIAIIILMICVSAIVLGTTRAFGVIDTEGYAIPADAGIVRALAGEGSAPIPLAQLHRDDEIYKAATGCYVGADRKKIDLAYPLYTNGGTGLRFFGEDNWLLTADVDLFKSYNGLYVSDGVSYNADMTQADDAEFILLALGNGLYMNVQQAVFENRLERAVIPINSILSLREGSIAWFEQNNGTLSYHEVQSVFEATITIGEHTYNYTDLLDALGLIREVIDHTDSDDKPDPDKLQQAETILNKKGSGGGKKPWRQKGTGHARQGSTRAPQWTHGGIVFAPKPRDYSYVMNKKVKRLALKSVLSAKAAEGKLVVIDSIKMDAIKTADFRKFLSAVKVDGKAVVVTPEVDNVIVKSARNIPGVLTTVANILSVYDIINAQYLVVDQAALAKICLLYTSPSPRD